MHFISTELPNKIESVDRPRLNCRVIFIKDLSNVFQIIIAFTLAKPFEQRGGLELAKHAIYRQTSPINKCRKS